LTRVVGLLIAMAALAGCALLPRPPATPDPAQPDLDACGKVLLPAADVSTFGPDAPDCVIVLWDSRMAGVVHPDGQRLLPPALVEVARAEGYSHDGCEIATNDRTRWLRHLPPVDMALPQTDAWIATIFARGPAQARAAAVCELIGS
jgi:hypothetical protein